MWNVAIVEDEAESSELLRAFLERFEKEAKVSLSVSSFADGMDFISDYTPKYDLVLLDIDMPHLNGLAAAKKLRKMDDDVLIVFVTNLAQYAIRGYEVEALDFLVKPVDYTAFAAMMHKAQRYLHAQRSKRVFLAVEDTIRCVLARDIRYIEVRGHFLTYHLTDEDIVVRGRMENAEAELVDCHFCRCHKSYLVNLNCVTEIGPNSVCVEGKQLALSRTRKKEFMQALADYLGSAV